MGGRCRHEAPNAEMLAGVILEVSAEPVPPALVRMAGFPTPLNGIALSSPTGYNRVGAGHHFLQRLP